MRRPLATTLMVAVPALLLGACSDESTEPLDVETALLDVIPPGGATNVDPNAPIVLEFDRRIGWGMEEYAVLHEGGINGPVVPGTWVLSDDRMTLTFTQDAPLMAATDYVIHLGGGLMDYNNRHLNLERHGFGLGGEWCTGEQLGPMGPGGPTGGHHHQGSGWQHPNGTYGMIFTFTTA